MYSVEEVKESTLKYFNHDDLATDVFFKYVLRDNEGNFLEKNPADMHRRIAKEFARIELKKFSGTSITPLSEEEILSYMENFKYIIPQGSPMFGIGNDYQIISLSNCYVVNSPLDSYNSIMETDTQLVNISKRRGGVGTDVSHIRPNKTPTKNSSRFSTGIIPFCERYSNSIREVGQENRRGALMLTLSIHHPESVIIHCEDKDSQPFVIKGDATKNIADLVTTTQFFNPNILDFCTMKMDRTKVTGANISLKLTNEFLQAVLKGEKYEQRWPVDAREKGQEPVISRWVDARTVWRKIIHCAWLCAEPGLLFWDTLLANSPADIYEIYRSVAVNPCSELSLPILDSCRLLLQNTFSYVDNPFTSNAKFNFDKFRNHARIALRLMDDLVDLESEKIQRILDKIDSDPEPTNVKKPERDMWEKIKWMNDNGRRTGLGLTGIGDTVAAVGLKYGSNESISLVGKIYQTLKLGAYRESVEIAKVLGAFTGFDATAEHNHPFFDRIKLEDIDLWNDMQKYGRRNVALLTTPPAGSTSILTKTTSGIEPVFALGYKRRRKLNAHEHSQKVDFIDAKGDKWQEYTVYHHHLNTWRQVTKNDNIEDSPYFHATANEIDWKQRVKLQAAAQLHVCHSLSSCLAVDESYLFTDQGVLDIKEIVSENIPEKSFGKLNFDDLNSINIDNNIAKITESYNNGLAETLEIELDSHNKIICTPNHKLVVLNQDYNFVWKEAQNIVESDIIVGRKGLNIWNKNSPFISTILGSFEYDKLSNSHKNITLPKRMSPDLARLIGYLMSDGSIGINGISLCQTENNIGSEFAGLIKDIFNLDCTKQIDNRSSNLYNWVVNSRELSAYFKYLGLSNDHNLNVVPKIVRMSGRECIKNFIRGITLDGYVTDNKICVSTSTSKKYLEQVQLLLLNLGVESIILRSSKEGERVFPSGKTYPTKESWCLLICNSIEINQFINLIGFAEDRKNQEIINKYIRPSRIKVKGEIPDYGLRLIFRKEILPNIKSNKLYDYFNSLTNPDKQGRFLCRESLQEMFDMGLRINAKLIDPTYTFSKVLKVQNGGSRQTYDVSVPDGNSYIVNGVISHNTINLPNNATEDDVSMIYQEAWKNNLKGITVYRDGCRTGVLVTDTKQNNTITKTTAIKRPKELPGQIFFTKAEGRDMFICVGLMNNDPYEVFASFCDRQINKDKIHGNSCTITKIKRGHYKITFGDLIIENVNDHITNNEATITRLLSLSLRHGADIKFAVESLDRIDGPLHSFSKAIGRILKKFIPDGTTISGDNCGTCGGQLVREEGCAKCIGCGWSKCS